ncbi:MAG: hypothetical protein U0229_23195 [Anaeromyxobacter sp.]
MTTVRLLALTLATLPLAASASGADHRSGGRIHVSGNCTVEKGPNDRVSQNAPLVIEENAQVEEAVAIGGDLTIRRGAVVQKAVAIGGNVRVEAGATVLESVVALGGDLRVANGARIGEDAVALGGRLEVQQGGEVKGNRVGLDVTLGDLDLKGKFLAELHLQGCEVVAK